MSDRESAQEYFRMVLLTVVGQAFDAAGYTLEQRPVKWAGGLFRFRKDLENGLFAFIEFQLLAYTATEWAAVSGSRFRVSLIRSDQPSADRVSDHPASVRKTLSELVVGDFGVNILPSADHWWTYSDTDSLGHALAEAGHLAVGYGMPWLAGELEPPSG